MRILTALEQVAVWREAMPWFHRTDDELPIGGDLLPYNEVNPTEQEVGTSEWNPNKTYIYQGDVDNPFHHGPYGGYGKHIYEIEPSGIPERDHGDGNNSAYMVDRGKVLRKVEGV